MNTLITYFGLEIHSQASCANVGIDLIWSSFFKNSSSTTGILYSGCGGSKMGDQDVSCALSDVLHASKCLKNYFEDQGLLNSFGETQWKYCGILM